MHGPAFPSLLPFLDSAVALLQQAGFGDLTAYAYSALFNHAFLMLAPGDDRKQHEGNGAGITPP
ncbi:hypothetical protein [Lysinibacter sp. HNR]|uniref:hypothetical protein n=1 Tax=Lysinibacter sp. HNR TaxID=3031408 RepID=UPI0024356CBC|nr:hypothetical protein [Lysinibacter sp. HNR]WGD37880.1 hypothetical protein FrondiHNR_02910 [Lysinibacter sp. HNR]